MKNCYKKPRKIVHLLCKQEALTSNWGTEIGAHFFVLIFSWYFWFFGFLFRFPGKKPIKMPGHGSFRYDVHGDEKQKYFFSLKFSPFFQKWVIVYVNFCLRLKISIGKYGMTDFRFFFHLITFPHLCTTAKTILYTEFAAINNVIMQVHKNVE